MCWLCWEQFAKGGQLAELAELLQQNPGLLLWRGPGVGHTALHWAAAKGHTTMVEWLAAAGTPADLLNSEGSTALHAAAANGELECVKVSADHSGDSRTEAPPLPPPAPTYPVCFTFSGCLRLDPTHLRTFCCCDRCVSIPMLIRGSLTLCSESLCSLPHLH